jgi:hypothetical protein
MSSGKISRDLITMSPILKSGDETAGPSHFAEAFTVLHLGSCDLNDWLLVVSGRKLRSQTVLTGRDIRPV